MTSEIPSNPSAERGRGRNRPPPRPVEVVSVERITPRLVSVVFGGEALAGFREPQPTAHIKLFLPDEAGNLPLPTAGPDGLVWPRGRPTMRTFTPRRYDAAGKTLEVQFVLHGDGVASRWAERAVPGDRTAIGGPGGGLVPAAADWWIGADESALPAAATLVEALPATATAEVHLEVEDEQDHADLFDHPGVTVFWHDRRNRSDDHTSWGAGLLDALRNAALDPHSQVWVACEASAVRRARAHLLTDRSHLRSQVTTRGYWRLGEANHPDHDYGED